MVTPDFSASICGPGVHERLAFFLGQANCGIQVLAAAYLALNQRGEGSSPSGPTEDLPWRTSPEWSSPSQGEERGFESHPGYFWNIWPGGGIEDTQLSEGWAHRGVRVQVPPWPLTSLRGRLTARRRTLTPLMLVRLQPPELIPCSDRVSP